MTFPRVWIALVAIALLCCPLPAFAHPGHVGPSNISPQAGLDQALMLTALPDVTRAVWIAVGLGAVAWLGMLGTLVILRYRLKRATDRFLRARLGLDQARADIAFWRRRRAFWRSHAFTADTHQLRAACELARLLDHEPNERHLSDGTPVHLPARRMIQPPRD